MPRSVFLAFAAVVAGGWLAAAPVPQPPAAVVAGLNDPATKVRDEAVAALANRPDAAPWVRRAARSPDRDTAARAAKLLAGYAKKRQEVARQAIDACVKSGQVDLFMEWHHYWQPESKDDLWPVGPRMARAGQDEYARRCPPNEVKRFEERLNLDKVFKFRLSSYDGPWAQLPRKGLGALSIRTDQWSNPPSSIEHVGFASVAGPALLERPGGRFFVLGSVFRRAGPTMNAAFVVCDGEFYDGYSRPGFQYWGQTGVSFVACRGDFRGGSVIASVLLVDGDIELFDDGSCEVKDSLIRATGEIRILKNVKPVNCTIEAHAKNATSPYKFFELADVGVSLADDEEGLFVAGVKADTPFGNSGLANGDIIQAIDDARAGHSELFRKQVRKAMVVQGDCLLTVARGNRTLDLAVHFPLPK